MTCRQTLDSYSLSATPSLGFLRRPSGSIYSMYEPGIDSNFGDNIKSKLLIECSKIYSKEDVDKISRKISSWSGRGSLPDQLIGELPITFGCSVTQTVFNCKNHIIFFNITPVLLTYSNTKKSNTVKAAFSRVKKFSFKN